MKSVTCKCGEICLEIENDPMMHFMCHCKDCHALFNGPAKVLIYTDDDIYIKGAHSTYSYQGGSGNDLHVTFCSNCGTRAYTRPDLIEGLTYVFASMLEEHINSNQKLNFSHIIDPSGSTNQRQWLKATITTEPLNVSKSSSKI